MKSAALAGTFALALALLALPTTAPAAVPGQNGKVAFTSERDGNREIYIMNADGTEQTNLTNTPGVDEYRPAWSPDGRRIAFVRSNSVWVMKSDGSDQVEVTAGDSPAWSPDGSRIVFANTAGQDADIYTARLDGSGEVKVTDDPGFDGFPVWSPDGTRIAFDSDRGGNRDIWIAGADGSNPTDLTPESGTQVFPSWSPDGSRIALQYGAPFEVYVMNADGSDLEAVGPNPGFDGEPAWSPDGAQIAFGSDRDGNEEIYVMNADGSDQVNLTNNPARDAEADWQPIVTPGDADCDEDADAVDALLALRAVAGLLPFAACIGAGNVKCDDGVTAVDALLILRHVAGLPVNLPQSCPDIGS